MLPGLHHNKTAQLYTDHNDLPKSDSKKGFDPRTCTGDLRHSKPVEEPRVAYRPEKYD
jgi:hypothetical protein